MSEALDRVYTVTIVCTVVLTVLAVALEISRSDLTRAFRSGRLLTLILAVNVVAIPAISLMVLRLLPLGHDTVVAVFLVTVGSGGAVGLKAAQLTRRADLGLAVALVIVLQACDVLAVPAWLHAVTRQGDVEPRTILTSLLGLVLVPLTIGLVVAALWPRVAQATTKASARLATLALVVAIAAATVGHWGDIQRHLLSGVAAAAVVVVVAGLALGAFSGGPAADRRAAAAMVSASRFASLGLVVIGTQLDNASRYVAPAVSAALINLVLVVAAAVAASRRDRGRLGKPHG